jgi:ferredoxin-NADP reductase
MAKMTVLKENQVVMELPLEPLIGIGRHPKMRVQLEDPLLSRNHAEVYLEGNDYLLRDTRSSNGTFLNGRKLDPGVGAKLADGDVAQIGPFLLRFQIPESKVPVVEATMALASPPPGVLAEAPPPPSPLLQHLVEGMAKRSIPVWSTGETTLRVADIIDETDDVKTFRMVGIDPILFSYRPGQFITLNLDIEGKKILRSYSLSSSPSRPHTLEVTVKRVPGGLVSNWLADNLKLGDLIKVRGPSGKFTCFEFPARKILLVGGGSGITPVMSMCRWIVDTTADVDVKFFVAVRTPRDIIFRKELELMSARHSGLQVVVTSSAMGSGTEAWMGFSGRCTQKMFEMIAPDINERHIFMCGPEPFMTAVKEILRGMNFPLANLHTESFGGARVAAGSEVKSRDVPVRQPTVALSVAAARAAAAGPAPAAPALAPAAQAAPAPSTAFDIVFASSGKTVKTDGKSAILDLAEANGIEIDYACRTGSCGTCKVLCKSGQVEMEDDSGLEAAEKKEGWVLTCVGTPRSSVVLDV